MNLLIEQFNSVMGGETGVGKLFGLVRNPGRLTDSEVRDLLDPVLTALKGSTDPNDIQGLEATLKVLAGKLTDYQAKNALPPLLDGIRHSTQPAALRALGAALAVTSNKLYNNDAQEGIRELLDEISSTKNPYAFPALAAGLGALRASLSDYQAEEAVRASLAAIERMYTLPILHPGYAVDAVGPGLQAVAAKMTDQQANNCLGLFLTAIEADAGRGALDGLGRGLETLSSKLSPGSAKTANHIVNEVLEKTRSQTTFAVYAKLSVELARNDTRDQRVVRIFRFLRNPLSAGEIQVYSGITNTSDTLKPTEDLLALLEQVEGVPARFSGDLWKAVEWAEAEQKAGRLRELDLDAALKL